MSADAPSAIRVESLAKRFGAVTALVDISLSSARASASA